MSVWNIGWIITTKSTHNRTYRIEIYTKDTVQNVKTLHPAKVCFEFHQNNDENPYTPLRGSTGYVRFMNRYDNDGVWTKIDENTVRPSSYTDRLVKVFQENTLYWTGFLVPEEFEGEFCSSDVFAEVSIPCNSLIQSLYNVRLENFNDSNTTNVGKFLLSAFDQMTGDDTLTYFRRVYFTKERYDNTEDILLMSEAKIGYTETDENTGEIKGKKYGEIFEDVFKFYGMSVHDLFGNLYLVETDDDSNKMFYFSGSSFRSYVNNTTSSATQGYSRTDSIYDFVSIEGTNNEVLQRSANSAVTINVSEPDVNNDIDIKDDSYTYQTTDDEPEIQYTDIIGSDFSQNNVTLHNSESTKYTSAKDVVKPVLFDIWDSEEDENKNSYNHTKGFSIKTQSAVSSLSESKPAITIRTKFKVSKDTTVTYANGYSLSFNMLRDYAKPTKISGEYDYVLMTFKCGDYYYRNDANGWEKSTIHAFHKIKVDEEGKSCINEISALNNAYRRHLTNATGYLVMLDYLPKSANDYLDITIYAPSVRTGYSIGSSGQLTTRQVISNISISSVSDYRAIPYRTANYERDGDSLKRVVKSSVTSNGEETSIDVSAYLFNNKTITNHYAVDIHVGFGLLIINRKLIKIGSGYVNHNINILTPLDRMNIAGFSRLRCISQSNDTYNDNGELLFTTIY